MDFGEALTAIRRGEQVARKGWNGKGMWVELHAPEGENERSYLRMSCVDGDLVPWVASQTDLLQFDWYVV